MTMTMNTIPAVRETGRPLTDADLAGLAARWISADMARDSGIKRVDSQDGARFIGRQDNGFYAGLLIPYFPPGERRVRGWRLHRDQPDLEFIKGKRRETGKYLWPTGRGNMVYFPPGLQPGLLKAVDTPVIITEGEFKTLALWRLAHHDSDSTRFLPLGLGGVWSWRGNVGKTTGPNGDRRDVKGVIPDLDLIGCEDRRVIIAFAADAERNEQVEAARSCLARVLRMRGAEVAFVTWDIAKGKGIDDLLATVGPEEVLALLGTADFEKPGRVRFVFSDRPHRTV
jgi:hypothetical protein